MELVIDQPRLIDTPTGVTGGERITLGAQVTLKAFTKCRPSGDGYHPLHVTEKT